MSVPTLVLASTLCAAGCGPSDEISKYKLVSVTGTVTLNGKPLEGAEVAFIPEAGTVPSTAGNDLTGPEGNYKIMFHGRSGLAPGKYQAIVKKTILPSTGGKAAALPEDIASDREMAKLALGETPRRKGSRAAAAPTLIEESFNREVTADGENVLDFDVKASAKVAR